MTAPEARRETYIAIALGLLVALIFSWFLLFPVLVRGALAAEEIDQRYPALAALRVMRTAHRMKRPRVWSEPSARGRHLSDANGNLVSERCVPASIRAAVDAVRAACGPVAVLSTLRPHARIPTGHVSLHAACQAEDFKPRNCACAYGVLKDWPYGLSLDCSSMGHIHISAPGVRNEGRFYHHGGRRTLMAKRRQQ